jgi:hypothetical protein
MQQNKSIKHGKDEKQVIEIQNLEKFINLWGWKIKRKDHNEIILSSKK